MELREELGREPTVHELAKHMGVDVSRVRLYSHVPDALSMEAAPGVRQSSGVSGEGAGGSANAGAGYRHETVACGGITPEQRAEMFLFQSKLEELMSVLSPDERLVVSLRYGLDGAQPTTITELAEMAGASKYRVQRVESRALNKLRRPARSPRHEHLLPATVAADGVGDGGGNKRWVGYGVNGADALLLDGDEDQQTAVDQLLSPNRQEREEEGDDWTINYR